MPQDLNSRYLLFYLFIKPILCFKPEDAEAGEGAKPRKSDKARNCLLLSCAYAANIGRSKMYREMRILQKGKIRSVHMPPYYIFY